MRRYLKNFKRTGSLAASAGGKFVKSLWPGSKTSTKASTKFIGAKLPKAAALASFAAHYRHRSKMNKLGNPLSGISTRLPYTRYKKGNANKVRGLKKVKVPARLRKQIKQTIEANHIHGYMQENYICTFNPAAPVNSNQTTTIENMYLPNDSFGSIFSWNHVLHCASRLWNGKAAGSTPQITDAGNFVNNTTKVTVKKQWVTIRIKNDSTRTLRMKVVSATPKGSKCLATPVAAWTQAVANEITSGRVINCGNGIAQLYTHPKIFDEFNNMYGTSEMDYTLEPGQSVEQNVQGPAMDYDGDKFFQLGAYNTFQKQDIFNFMVVTCDLIYAAAQVAPALAAVAGHLNDNTTFAPQNWILIEGTYHVQMSMPEPTGWQSGGIAPAAGAVANVNRVKRYVFDDFNTTPQEASAVEYRTDEQNPKP